MATSNPYGRECDRREFLTVAAAIPAALAAAGLCGVEADAGEAKPGDAAKMPQIPLGKHSISRLIVGCHDIDAGSHLGPVHNSAAREFYTLEQAVKTLRHCEDVGINCWQSHQTGRLLEIFQAVRKAGGKMVMVGLCGYEEEIKPMATIDGLIAVAHHGELTDRLFKTGKLDVIHDCLKRIRDAGLAVGVSTHMPAVVDAIESKGWDVDYYQTCVYERHRSAEELKKYLGHVPVAPGEVYLRDDPPRMFKAIQQTKRTCLAFKILAGGRRNDVEQAFRETFAGIKPTDAVVVGIYDRYSDQAGQNAALARRYG
jgi:hypothetical protein